MIVVAVILAVSCGVSVFIGVRYRRRVHAFVAQNARHEVFIAAQAGMWTF
jgi:hypothetical protein